MSESLRIEWEPGMEVGGVRAGPAEGAIGMLLAHGAGAGQAHPFMVGMRTRLGAAGFPTLTFDYPYKAAGRRAPDRLERLLACHRAAYERLAERVEHVVLAGKSMGGRVGGHLAVEVETYRLVFLGYPLVAIGKNEPRDTSHLAEVGCPILFVQGERDRLAPIAAITAVAESLGATIEVITDGDHSFKVPKRTGLSPDDMLDHLTECVVGFVG